MLHPMASACLASPAKTGAATARASERTGRNRSGRRIGKDLQSTVGRRIRGRGVRLNSGANFGKTFLNHFTICAEAVLQEHFCRLLSEDVYPEASGHGGRGSPTRRPF